MKKRRIMAGILFVIMAICLCFGTAETAGATGSQTSNETDAKAIITTVLQMDKNVTVPAGTFSFKVTKVSYDEKTSSDDIAKMPDLRNLTIAYASTDAGTTDSTTGIKSVRKQTAGSILPGCKTDGGFQHVGIYVYQLEENATGFTTDADNIMTWSKAKYTMTVYVSNKTGSDDLYISHVIVNRNQDDSGTDAKDVKIKNPGADIDGKPNDFVFTNGFTKMGGSTPGNPDPTIDKMDEPDGKTNRDSLKIFKVVTGDMGDKLRDFKFKLQLTKASALEPANKEYTATIKRTDGKVETVKFTVGTAKDFTLKHKEYLYFPALPVGTEFTVSEDVADGYDQTHITISNGLKVTATSDLQNVLVGEQDNVVGFQNNLESGDPDTGIKIDNLPFILLIVVAVSGLVTYFIIRRQRYKK